MKFGNNVGVCVRERTLQPRATCVSTETVLRPLLMFPFPVKPFFTERAVPRAGSKGFRAATKEKWKLEMI